MRKSNLLIIVLFCLVQFTKGQEKKILFIGNSYTFIEDIPNIFYEVANSTGDVLIVDAQTAGGATFEYHVTAQEVTDKINSDNWDYVVLQGQSIEVSLTGDYFDTNVAPYAAQLCQTIRENNSCTQPVFYNTWGREFGMATGGSTCTAYPWVCTYQGMDDALKENYKVLADTNDAIIAPVGPVWRYFRDNFIPIDLYIEDESHQTLEGAYAAACAFYAVILQKDPTLITYDGGVNSSTAAQIRSVVKTVVYDQLEIWKIGEFDPLANFTYVENDGQVNFTNTSINDESYAWDFGDSNTSTDENPSHAFTEIGDYVVELEVIKCGVSSTYNTTVNINALSIKEAIFSELKVFPNPSIGVLKIRGIDAKMVQSIKLFNLLGKEIPATFNLIESSLNITDLASGNYFLEIITKNGGKAMRKVLKK